MKLAFLISVITSVKCTPTLAFRHRILTWRRVRFFPRHVILNIIYNQAKENPLNLNNGQLGHLIV